MQLSNLYKSKKPVISFEIFPPKQSGDVEKLISAVAELKLLEPDFISITYGAAGSDSRAKTLEIATEVKNTYGIEALVHLTCVASTKESIAQTLENFRAHNIENILALRGDLPDGSLGTDKTQNEYAYAKDLIEDIRGKGFCIGAAAYPEGHIACEDFSVSIEHLKQKTDAGAEFLITQLFFDNELFYTFRNAAQKAGINVPIVAGVMPILSLSQIKRMIFMCGVSLPARIIKLLNKYENDAESLRRAGIEYSFEQIAGLIENGIDGVHIYTMNNPDIARQNVRLLKERTLI